MENKITKGREKNFELLRIIAMIMIIILHFNCHGGIMNNIKISFTERIIIYFLEYACIIAVNIYVMITGYYMVKSNIKISKIIKLELSIIFYSVGIYIILVLFNKCNFEVSTMIKSLFPILTKQYWFMSAYMGLYILIPFINKFINSMNKKEYKVLLIILTFLLSFVKTIYNKNDVFEVNGGYGLFWFIYLYLIAGYIRIYFDKKINNYKLFIIYFFMIGLQLLIKYISSKTDISILNLYSEISLQYNSFFVLIETIAVFLLFKDIKIKNNIINKIIEKVAPLTLGVYLIHEQPLFRDVLWNEILKPFNYLNNDGKIILILIIDVILIFTTCCVIEKLRMILFRKIEKAKIIGRINEKLDKQAKKYLI